MKRHEPVTHHRGIGGAPTVKRQWRRRQGIVGGDVGAAGAQL